MLIRNKKATKRSQHILFAQPSNLAKSTQLHVFAHNNNLMAERFSWRKSQTWDLCFWIYKTSEQKKATTKTPWVVSTAGNGPPDDPNIWVWLNITLLLTFAKVIFLEENQKL